jgi:peptide-methionine (R)-S-oxide reductase
LRHRRRPTEIRTEADWENQSGLPFWAMEQFIRQLSIFFAFFIILITRGYSGYNVKVQKDRKPMEKIRKSDEEWRRSLTPEQYRVLRERGTERPFTGQYAETSTPGVYLCAACGLELFPSEKKFDAGCGWPSFSDTLNKLNVEEHVDRSHGMTRTEVSCSRCGGHLGHVFPDGPNPTGLRYCVNSASLRLDKK